MIEMSKGSKEGESFRGFSSNPRFLTVGELADLLKISRGGIYNLVAAKKIPHFKGSGIGLRFEYGEILSWMQKRKVEVNSRNTWSKDLEGV